MSAGVQGLLKPGQDRQGWLEQIQLARVTFWWHHSRMAVSLVLGNVWPTSRYTEQQASTGTRPAAMSVGCCPHVLQLWGCRLICSPMKAVGLQLLAGDFLCVQQGLSSVVVWHVAAAAFELPPFCASLLVPCG